jgi:hypothetical protein
MPLRQRQLLLKHCDRWLKRSGRYQSGQTYAENPATCIGLLLLRQIEHGARGGILEALDLCFKRAGHDPALPLMIESQLLGWNIGCEWLRYSTGQCRYLTLWVSCPPYRRRSHQAAPFGWILETQVRPQPGLKTKAKAKPPAIIGAT